MRIVFWGTPNYAAKNLVSIIKAGYEITSVITQPDKKRGRGNNYTPSPVKQIAIEYGIPVYTTNSIRKDKIIQNVLKEINPDIFIVVAFGQILPEEIINLPSLGCWNSHASLLPKWRGAAPIQWSIIEDDSHAGVCIMSMEVGLDTGPIINKESIRISDNDNFETLSNKLCVISSNLILQLLNDIKDTECLDRPLRLEKLQAICQSDLPGDVSYARQIDKKDYIIDWNQDARKLLKKVKGLYPNCYTTYKGKRIKIFDVNLLNKEQLSKVPNFINLKSKHIQSGKILSIDKENGIIVMTKDYPIAISFGQLEGKNKNDGYTLSQQIKISVFNQFG